MPLEIHWTSDNPLEHTTDKIIYVGRHHWKSTMISEVLISGVQSLTLSGSLWPSLALDDYLWLSMTLSGSLALSGSLTLSAIWLFGALAPSESVWRGPGRAGALGRLEELLRLQVILLLLLVLSSHRWNMPDLSTKILDFRGFDSNIILDLRGGVPRPRNFPECLSQAIVVGIISVGTPDPNPRNFANWCFW